MQHLAQLAQVTTLPQDRVQATSGSDTTFVPINLAVLVANCSPSSRSTLRPLHGWDLYVNPSMTSRRPREPGLTRTGYGIVMVACRFPVTRSEPHGSCPQHERPKHGNCSYRQANVSGRTTRFCRGTFLSDQHTAHDQWAVKGVIDSSKAVYPLVPDTKLVSKILELQIQPLIEDFAASHGYSATSPSHQNHYPDVSLISNKEPSVEFALDVKSTYRNPDRDWLCNGFTLGSYTGYFRDRTKQKNIQFPYGDYQGHFILGIIYDRLPGASTANASAQPISFLDSLQSVISNIQCFSAEKWKIAGDKPGSGNTANIGSIRLIDDLAGERGMFSMLGEKWFDDYWMNYKTNATLEDFVKHRHGDTSRIVARRTQP